MNNNYTSENGGRKEVSGTTESRWHISTDVRNTLALFVGAVTLLAGVWGVCESSISRLADRFDQQDARFDQIDARFDELCVATHNSSYVEFGVMWSRAVKPLPRNTLGGFHST